MTTEFHKIWIDQCDAAEGIKDGFGTEKALGYLIGEKLMNFVKAAETRPEWAAEIPAFLRRVHEIFEPWELADYFSTVQRIGPMGHICSEEEHEFMREAGALEEDPVSSAQDAIRLKDIARMLMGLTDGDDPEPE